MARREGGGPLRLPQSKTDTLVTGMGWAGAHSPVGSESCTLASAAPLPVGLHIWIVFNSLSSLLSTNVLFSKRLCKIGYLNNPDVYPKYPDGYINGKRLCS